MGKKKESSEGPSFFWPPRPECQPYWDSESVNLRLTFAQVMAIHYVEIYKPNMISGLALPSVLSVVIGFYIPEQLKLAQSSEQ